jgi:phage FluMu protein Com/uncharacterized membrane protein
MPITLSCPSCGKRFRARDESAGKKVKCPYCQAAVQVPTPDESDTPAAALPPPPPPGSSMAVPRSAPPSRPLPPPPAPVVATPDDWGALPTGPKPPAPSAVPPRPLPPPPPPSAAPTEPDPVAFPPAYTGAGGRGAKERPKPAKAADKAKPKAGAPEETPEQILAAGWRKLRRGLLLVQFGLFFVALLGFVGFGKMVAARTGNDLPTGPGSIKIEGYINDPNNVNALPLSKTDELNLAMYGLPVLLGGMFVVLGRLGASGAPKSSGSRGMLSFSGIFLMVALIGLALSVGFDRLLMKDEYRYSWGAFVVLAPIAEFWFLTSLSACGLALKRPGAARAVGLVGFVAGLGAFVAVLGWDLYKQFGRPKTPDADLLLYEQGALMLGWLLLIGVYWRAIGSVRGAAREYLETVEGAA